MAGSITIAALHGAAACIALSAAVFTDVALHAQVLPPNVIDFDIPAGSLQSALVAFGNRTGLQLIYAPDAVAGRRVSRLHARLSSSAALRRLIAGTGLQVRQVDAKVLVIERQPRHDAPGAKVEGRAGNHLSRVDVGLDVPSSGIASEPVQSPEVVVTGSNIHGAAPVGSNVRTIQRAEIERNGYSTVAQALQALPGNFGGVSTEQSALAAVDRTGTNASLGTGVNLRGLGSNATLVLVNGRRIAGAGVLGDFADISTIPMSVVERVDVLMDGASAIYGSDAVGGVINIVLKDRFDGLESGARFGTVTKGGMREVEAYQTAGKSWGSGTVLLSYEFYRRTALAASDRAYARSADSRPFGGTDHRYIYSSPGNVLGFDPVTGGLIAAYGIPAGQDGTALKPGDFHAGVPNLENFEEGAWLTPQQTRHSVFAMLRQDVGASVHLGLEGRYTRRNFETLTPAYATILTITRANPWFVSPTGSASDLIGYSFRGDLGPERASGWSETMGITGSIDVDLPHRWKLSAYGAYAQSREESRTDRIANEAILAEALGAIPDDPATPFSTARDGYFNPYGNGRSNTPAVLAAIGSGYLDGRYVNRITTGNIQADGPLFDLPGGAVRFAVGGNIRREGYSTQNSSFYLTPTPQIGAPIDYGRTITAAYAELRVPLLAPDNGVPGFRRLDLSLAGRTEHYPNVGSTTNPKVGLTWAPVDGLSFRGTYGKSFRAPNLSELHATSGVTSNVLQNAAGASVLVLRLDGGNPSLKPERASSWTLGVDVAPPSLPGLHASATLFRTIFTGRIDIPVARDYRNALTNADLAPFVRLVSPGTNATDRADVTALLAQVSGAGASFPVDSVAAIVDARWVNTAQADVRGIDLSIGYSLETGGNKFSIDANGTYLTAWRQRTTPASASLDQRNLPGKPVDFRGRATFGWQRGAFDALLGLNYVDGYRDPVAGRPISSWATVDLRLAWNGPKQSWFSGGTIALIAQNLFDRAPPFYDSTAGVGYDAGNADATGRFVSIQITKRW